MTIQHDIDVSLENSNITSSRSFSGVRLERGSSSVVDSGLDISTSAISAMSEEISDIAADSGTGTVLAIQVGTPQEDIIERSNDSDWFRVELEAGSYTISLQGSPTQSGSLSDPLLQGVYDASGRYIASTRNDDGGVGYNSQTQLTINQAGTYYIAAAAYGSNTGTYTLSIDEEVAIVDDYLATIETAGEIDVNSSQTGSIEAGGDNDWFRVELEAGTYSIALNGSQSDNGTLRDPYLAGVYDASGRYLNNTRNDDGGAGLNSLSVISIAEAGVYYISASAYGNNTGTYTLSIDEKVAIQDDYLATIETAGKIEVSSSQIGSIETAGDDDWFKIELEAGTYSISLNGALTNDGTLSDPYLNGVYDASGRYVNNTRNDDGGSGLNSLSEITVAEAGSYFIAASAYGNRIGTYTLAIEPVNIALVEVTIDRVIDSSGELIENGNFGGNAHLSGRGESGYRVDIFNNDRLIGSTVVDENGEWQFTDPDIFDLTVIRAPTANVYTAQTSSLDGNDVSRSEEYTVYHFHGDQTIIVDDQGDVTGWVGENDVTDDNSPLISGFGYFYIGDIVALLDNGIEIARTTVSEVGIWEVNLAEVLANGEHSFEVNNITTGAEVYTQSFTVDAIAADPIQIDSVIDSSGEQYESGAIVPNNGFMQLRGRGESGHRVDIFTGDTLIGSTVVDANGEWQFVDDQVIYALVLGPPLAKSYTAQTYDSAGNIASRSNEFVVNVFLGEDTYILDDVGSVQGIIGEGGTTDDSRPEVSGFGRFYIGDIIALFDNGEEIARTTVSEIGAWVINLSEPIETGEHLFEVNNITTGAEVYTQAFAFGFDVAGLYPPLIESVFDDAGNIVLHSGQTSEGNFTIIGRSDPNIWVEVFEGDNLLGRAMSDDNGAWSYTAGFAYAAVMDLPPSDFEFQARIVSETGVIGPLSSPYSFTVNHPQSDDYFQLGERSFLVANDILQEDSELDQLLNYNIASEPAVPAGMRSLEREVVYADRNSLIQDDLVTAEVIVDQN